jgi:hypothetical protein
MARPLFDDGGEEVMRRLLAFALASLAAMSTLAADDPRMHSPTGLIISYSTAPADRPALRAALLRDEVTSLDALKRQGVIAHYRLLWSCYADNVNWDAMLVLDLDTKAGIGGWAKVEAGAPGGLTPSAVRLVKRIDSASMDVMRNRRDAGPVKPVYLVVPYDYLIGVNDYLKYVDGYVVPQMDGWIAEHALQGYDFLLARYPAGRPWSAMLLLDYRGDEGLGMRDAVVGKVRAGLGGNPAWKALADNKQQIRDERAPVIADMLAER